MSDSDSDEAFESADEGEDIPQHFQTSAFEKLIDQQQDDSSISGSESVIRDTKSVNEKSLAQSTNFLNTTRENEEAFTSAKDSIEIENSRNIVFKHSNEPKCDEGEILLSKSLDENVSKELQNKLIDHQREPEESEDDCRHIKNPTESVQIDTNIEPDEQLNDMVDVGKLGNVSGEVMSTIECVEQASLKSDLHQSVEKSSKSKIDNIREQDTKEEITSDASEHGKSDRKDFLKSKSNEKEKYEINQNDKCYQSSSGNDDDEAFEASPSLAAKQRDDDSISDELESQGNADFNIANLKIDKDHFVVSADESKSMPSFPQELEDTSVVEDSCDEVGWEVDNVDIDSLLEEAEQRQVQRDNFSPQIMKHNRPSNDAANPLDQLASSSEKSSSWGWGSWRSSILSTAAASVSVFSDHVGQGLGAVMESAESTLGAPSPEEMAAISSKRKQHEKEKTNVSNLEEKESAFKLGMLFTGVSSIIETTGSKVLEGSVGALEKIGKKTIDIITEGDPGLKKKRAMLSGNRPVLSQVLRQAKEQSIEEEKELVDEKCAPVNFPMMFDKFNGLMYLEALEMLSEQCRIKVESKAFLSSCSDEAKNSELLDKIDKLCSDVPDEEVEELKNFNDVLTECYQSLNINYSPSKLIEVMNNESQKSKATNCLSAEVAYESAICAQASLTAVAIEQLHKIADLVIIDSKTDKLQQTEIIVSIAACICSEIEAISTCYAEKLIKMKDSTEDVDHLTTNIYFEMSNSTSYVHDAMRLMAHVLKLSVLSF